MKKNNRPLYGSNDEVSKICATCKHARPLETENDYLCDKHGVVERGYTCRSYKINLLLKRPPKKRSINTARYNPEDFSID